MAGQDLMTRNSLLLYRVDLYVCLRGISKLMQVCYVLVEDRWRQGISCAELLNWNTENVNGK